MPQEGIRSSAVDGTLRLESPQYQWPADTNILYGPGSNKIALTCQRPLIRVVIQDAMENVRADLLFKDAYPDPAVALVTIKESLLASASRHPGASSIRRRLVFDEQYMTAMIPLVSFLTLDGIILTQSTAACSDSALPKRDQRAVRSYCLSRTFSRHFRGSNQIKCYAAVISIQLYVPSCTRRK
jgi:hypothetical protein